VTKKYSILVSTLLTYGDCREIKHWPDYLQHGFREEHIPDLIQMATDPDLNKGDPNSLKVWAPVHAWRILGQLKAEMAIEPLTSLLRMFDTDDDDFVGEELRKVFGMIGEKAIPVLENYVFNDLNGLFDRIAALNGLERIAANNPQCREQCISIFQRKLRGYENNNPTLNAFLVTYLVDLEGVEAIDEIRQAYEADRVDLSVLGDFEDVEIRLGFTRYRTKPPVNLAEVDRIKSDFSAQTPVKRKKIGRNEPCPCGSGKKYKKCCIDLGEIF
jgi:hypothetical protein